MSQPASQTKISVAIPEKFVSEELILFIYGKTKKAEVNPIIFHIPFSPCFPQGKIRATHSEQPVLNSN